MKKQWFFRILIYLSFVFLLIYLAKIDYLSFKTVSFNYTPLIIAILLLWSGFVLSSLSWHYALRIHSVKIPKQMAIASHGLSVFAKYIPGKIWVILGRASYVANKKGLETSVLSYISLKEQLIYILLGLILSFIPTLVYFNRDYWIWIIFATILGLAAILFVKKLHDWFEWILSKIFKKEFNLPYLSIKLSLKLGFRISLYWIFWTVGFYFFMLSFSDDILPLHAFVFPLAVSYGVLAIFLPGGIGVRESIITAYLVATGIELETAITISALSRLWFISGEVFLFLVAFFIKKKPV